MAPPGQRFDIVRERLQRAARPTPHQSTMLDTIADLIGSVDGLPADLSARKKQYLKATGYGQKCARWRAAKTEPIATLMVEQADSAI